MDLKNKVAVVTGSAHRVGRGIALQLASAGANVVIHYNSSEHAARETAGEVRALGVDAFTVQSDLSDPDNILMMFDRLYEHFHRLDVLVNSASAFDHQPFDQVTPESWDKSLTVNVRAPMLCIQHAARLMRATERTTPGCIVNISDITGIFPVRNLIQHGVSKAALLHLTKSAALELAPVVRVNALVLGPIIPPEGSGLDDPDWQRLINWLPMKRQGGVDAVGKLVVDVIRSDYMTGSIIELDGGQTLKGPLPRSD